MLNQIGPKLPTTALFTEATHDFQKAFFSEGVYGPFIPASLVKDGVFNLIGTLSKERTNPFLEYVVEGHSACQLHLSHYKTQADTVKARPQPFFRRVSVWRNKALPPLPLERFIDSVKTLPAVKKETVPQDPAVMPSSKNLSLRGVLEAASLDIDALLVKHIHNKNNLSQQDREQDLALIKAYQAKIRAAYAAPEAVIQKGSSSQPPLMLAGEAFEANKPIRRSATVCDIPEGVEEELAYLETVYTEGSNPHATTVEEIADESEEIESSHSEALSEVEKPPEPTFAQSWLALKAMAQTIAVDKSPEVGVVQKICLTILSVLNRVAVSANVPFIPLIVDVIKYIFELHILAAIRE